MSTPEYRINHQITAKELRLLREDGTQIGVVTLSDALSQAQSANVDLVEIAPLAAPPVAKLIDYKKFLYQQAKKEQTARSATKRSDLKEVRLTPFMAQNDFDHRLRQAREFLADGNKLRVTVKFVGRQLNHKEFGEVMMGRVQQTLVDYAVIDRPGKWVGKQYIATFTPVKKSKSNVKAENQKVSKQAVQGDQDR